MDVRNFGSKQDVLIASKRTKPTFYSQNPSLEEKDRLLRKYWSIPERQVETSVVLTDRKESIRNIGSSACFVLTA